MRTLLLNMNRSCDICVTKMVVQLDDDVDGVTPAVEGETLTLRIPTTPALPVSLANFELLCLSFCPRLNIYSRGL